MTLRTLVRSRRVLPVVGALLLCSALFAQQQNRPPAVPLIVHGPYFSLWSMSDQLTGSNTKHWTGVDQPLDGLIRIDGKVYRYLGAKPADMPELVSPLPAMTQRSVVVAPLHTTYCFEEGGVRLTLAFFTPSFPKDLEVLSRPVSYVTWTAQSLDGAVHKVDLLLDVDPGIAVNEPSEPVLSTRTRSGSLTVLNVGSEAQHALNRSGDRIRIDWGHFHLIVPDSEHARTALSYDSLARFSRDGTLPAQDDAAGPRPAAASAHPAHLAVAFALDAVSAQPVERHVLVAYTEGDAIEYLGHRLKGYWRRGGMSESALFQAAESEHTQLEKKGVAFDRDLMAAMTKAGGADYAYLTALAFRQTLGAHKLVAGPEGQPMLFSKENGSNGCIDTVDVTYPSSPFFLFFNPRLLKAQLEPMMRYAASPRWRFPFAPHDLGTYPLANGQVYGGGEKSEQDQMPVEESADLILMISAMEREQDDWSFAAQYYPQLEQWAAYLAEKGMDPANQLSTDDFAGHLAHNANLSLKAIEALAAFSDIARHEGHADTADRYQQLARSMPARWIAMAQDGDHFKLAFDQPGTWSQLYNLVWDQLLDLHLFPASVAREEWTFYDRHMQRYGLPLDSRKTITKLDWEIWTATLAPDPAQFRRLAASVRRWTDESPSRVPLTDYYDTVTGRQIEFQARSVVGGILIKALADPALARSWRSR